MNARSLVARNNRGSKSARARKGEAIISVVFGSTILIVICLFAADAIFLTLANSANDTLARNAARAAANVPVGGGPQLAAQAVVSQFKVSNLIPNAEMTDINYTSDRVTVKTRIVVNLPASLLGWPKALTFVAKDTESVVGNPSTL